MLKTHPSTSLLSRYSITSLGIAALLFSGIAGLSSCRTPELVAQGPLTVYADTWLDGLAKPATYLEKQLAQRLPASPGVTDRRLFTEYRPEGPSVWAPHWPASLDFSGVAWDDPRAGTLIHPQYVVFASHFPRRLRQPIVFHDRAGQRVERQLVSKRIIHQILHPDLTVARLDRPVPSTVAHYPLLTMGPYPSRSLVGAPLLVTDKERRVHLFRINRILRKRGFELLGARPPLGSELGAGWQERLEKGDSGHPAFVVIDGRLVLVSTLKGGGWASVGPFLGGARMQKAVKAAIAHLEALARNG